MSNHFKSQDKSCLSMLLAALLSVTLPLFNVQTASGQSDSEKTATSVLHGRVVEKSGGGVQELM